MYFRRENAYVNVGEDDKSVKCFVGKSDRNDIQLCTISKFAADSESKYTMLLPHVISTKLVTNA